MARLSSLELENGDLVVTPYMICRLILDMTGLSFRPPSHLHPVRPTNYRLTAHLSRRAVPLINFHMQPMVLVTVSCSTKRWARLSSFIPLMSINHIYRLHPRQPQVHIIMLRAEFHLWIPEIRGILPILPVHCLRQSHDLRRDKVVGNLSRRSLNR